MLSTALTAVITVAFLLGGWILVQAAWRRVFPDEAADKDVMEGRLGCRQCLCDVPCERLQGDMGENVTTTSNQSKGK